MPQYTVTDPTSKKTVTLTGDSPPTEAELTDIFTKVNGPAQPDGGGGDNLAAIAGLVKDVGIGAVKKLGETGVRGGALLRKIPGVSAVSDAIMTPREVNITPTNTAQKIGGVVEQGAELIAPSKALYSGGLKAAEMVGPRLAPHVGHALARILPRVAVESAGSALLAKAQGADTSGAVTAGALGAVAPTIGEAAVEIAAKLRASAAGNVADFFNPTTKGMKRIVAKRTADVLDRTGEVFGATGRNRQGAADAFAEQRATAGEAVDEALSKFGSDVVQDAPQRLIAALDEAKAPFLKTRTIPAADLTRNEQLQKYVTSIDEATGTATLSIPLNPRKIKQVDALKEIVAAHGQDMSVDDLVGLRRAWDEIAYEQPGASLETVRTKAEKWAKKMGGDAIRAIVESDKPDLAAINREFSFWKDLSTVITATNDRKVGQVGGLLPSMAEGAGRVAGAMSGGIGTAILVGKTAKTAQQVFASPRYASLAAGLKTSLGKALVAGDAAAFNTWLRVAAIRTGVEAPRALATATP